MNSYVIAFLLFHLLICTPFIIDTIKQEHKYKRRKLSNEGKGK